MKEVNIPEEYKPISPIGYFGYEILFGFPLVGFIVSAIFAFGAQKNINVKNFAKLYFWIYIISIVVGAIVGVAFGIVAAK